MLAQAVVIFSIIFPVFAVIGSGFAYAKFKAADMRTINTLTMDVFVPALVFIKLVESDFSLYEYLPLTVGALFVTLGSGALLLPIVSRLKVANKTFIPPMMFANAANIGIPLQVLAFGNSAMAAALVLVLVFNLLQFSLGIYILDRKTSILNTFKQPVIIAGILAVVFKINNWNVAAVIAMPIDMLADICVPLMLFSLGVRLSGANFSDIRLGISAAIVKPMVGVLLAVGVGFIIDIPHQHWGNLILFGALPPAVMNFLLAERYQQQPQQVASIVMIGNLMSIVTLPLTLFIVLPIFGN